MENATAPTSILDEELNNYFEHSFFQYTGHHSPSNKGILILSPKSSFKHPSFTNIEKITEKTVKDLK